MKIVMTICTLMMMVACNNEQDKKTTPKESNKKATQSEEFIIYTEEWAPFQYYDKDEKLTGYSVEILHAMLKDLKIKPKILVYPWTRALRMTLENKNAMTFTMARTPDREKNYRWVGPLADRQIYFWQLKSRSDINAKTIEEIKKYIVGSGQGDAGEKELINKGFVLHDNLRPVATMEQNYKMLFKKKIDFLYGLDLELNHGIKQAGLDPSQVKKSLLLSGGMKYYFGFHKNASDKLVNKFQNALDKLKSNGIFEKIRKKYVSEKE